MILFQLVLGRGLSISGALALGSFMLFDPIVTVHGSLAHVESALTLLVPLSLLLFESGRHRSNTGKIVAGGIAFGLAFATRVSASVIPLTPVLFLLVDSRKLASSFQNRVLKLARGFAQLLFFAFVAYLTLVLVYPPFWRHPVSGFFESLFQYGAFVEGGPGSFWAAFLTTFPATTRATGLIFFGLGVWGFFISDVRSQSLFKLGWIYYLVGVLIVSFGLYPGRYLSSIIPGLGLAGSLAFAHLWSHLESRVGWRSKTLPYLFFLLTISLSSVLVSRDLRLWAERKVLYSQLKASTLGRVHVESPKILIRGPQNLNPRSPTLHLLVQDWHLQLVYWNIAITDRFVRHETFTQGWEKENLSGSECLWSTSDFVLVKAENIDGPVMRRVGPYTEVASRLLPTTGRRMVPLQISVAGPRRLPERGATDGWKPG